MRADEMLRNEIVAELSYDPRLIGAHIEVAVAGRTATLTGHVRSYDAKIAAEKAAQRVRGIRAIAVDLHVTPVPEAKHDDREIAKRIANVLAWSAGVPDSVKAVVDQGWVSLSGNVQWNYQRLNAERLARGLDGVVGIFNNIVVTPSAAPTDIRERIQAALARNARIEANAIKVAVDGSVVTLSGTVAALHERATAEHAAWAAPGVTEVKNELTLS